MIRKLSCVVLISVVCAWVGPALGQDSDPSLMGWWTFDGDVLDSSGHDRHGTLGGDPQFVPGVYGQALEFDGDDSVTVTDYKGIEGKNPFSIAAWIKTESPDYKTIVTWGSAVNGAKIEFRIINNVLRVNHGAGNVNSASVVNDGQWHHVTLTVAENSTVSYPEMILYVDGVDDTVPSTDADPPLDIVPSFDVGIGWRSTNNDRYWEGMIDEVRIYDRVLTPGEVKALAIRPKAYKPDPADGTVGVATPMLTWQPRQTALFHDVYLGTSPELGPADLVSSRQVFALYYHVAGLEPGATYYWRIDEIDPDGTVHAGDVWHFVTQALTAYYPDPADGVTDAPLAPNLTWLPGQGAIKHHLYFGDSADAVRQGTPETDKGELTEPNFAPGTLESLETYSWRVDEVIVGGTLKTGPVWSFTTALPVDDFESYTDDEGSRIYETWIDGWTNDTGSQVGNSQAPFAELTVVRGGRQSMPLDYNNVNLPYYSEAEREFTPTQDWTAGGIDTLVLSIRGRTANGVAALYVTIEDSAGKTGTIICPDPAIVTTTAWTDWKPPLSDFTGVNMARVKKLTIGVGDRNAASPGGVGRVYIDDIRATKSVPVVEE